MKTVFPDFGPWLTYAEAIQSHTADKLRLDNTPTLCEYQNMKRVYERVYAPLCEHFGKKLPVSSFFRSEAVNRAVGGSKTSDHRFGRAIDIDCYGLADGPTNLQLFQYVRANLSFDQLIKEFPDAFDRPAWIHIGYRSLENNRKQVLTIR